MDDFIKVLAIVILLVVGAYCIVCFGDAINVPALADAIYKAEGGANTSHPYGILTKYKTTTPRQACINTINHALRDWDGTGDFVAFLGSRYCPVGAKNDPTGLNVNWVKNVNWFLRHEN